MNWHPVQIILFILVLSLSARAQKNCTGTVCDQESYSCNADRACLSYADCCPVCCETECNECETDPCDKWHCPGVVNATCQSDTCGGCTRAWYTPTGEKAVCPEELQDGDKPCAEIECEAFDASNCTCGATTDRCKCQTCCPADTCVPCETNPCKNYTCKDYPGYYCRPNECGECSREWFTSAGESIVCDEELQGEPACEECPELDVSTCTCGLESTDGCCPGCCAEDQCQTCDTNPCDTWSCLSNANFTCEPNTCGGCSRDWFDADHKLVSCPREKQDCAAVTCPALDCKCGREVDPANSCCKICTNCTDCAENPCKLYNCTDNADWTCSKNPDDCSRIWKDADGNVVNCTAEEFGGKWKLKCEADSDCALHNTDLDFACCWAGFCDEVDFSQDIWKPVNSDWWDFFHDACSKDCGPQPGCPTPAPNGTDWNAFCVEGKCKKQQGDAPDPENPDENPDDPDQNPDDPDENPDDPNQNPDDPNQNPDDPDENPDDPNQNPDDPNQNPDDPNQNPDDPNQNPDDPNQNPDDPNQNPDDPNQNPDDPNQNPDDPNQNPVDPNNTDPNQNPFDPNNQNQNNPDFDPNNIDNWNDQNIQDLIDNLLPGMGVNPQDFNFGDPVNVGDPMNFGNPVNMGDPAQIQGFPFARKEEEVQNSSPVMNISCLLSFVVSFFVIGLNLILF